MEKRTRASTVLESGKELNAELTWLQDGLHVLYIGGKTHVGAISYAEGGTIWSCQAAGHKEQIISESWAKTLSEYWNCPVTVCCGIHFDGISGEEIKEIVNRSEQLLQTLCTGREWKRKEENNAAV